MGKPAAAPVSAKALGTANRTQLLQLLEQTKETRTEWIRRMVIQHNRIDILAEMVLGYTIAPRLHRRILLHQLRHKKSLTLIYRGAGKTTVGTITKAIHLILQDPNVRILITSKTAKNAEDFLKEIKGHFEANERFREIFGDFVGDNRWDQSAIEVKGRTRPAKEPTINTVGMGGAIASKHYDVILADDLVDEENSRTKVQREHMLEWHYKVLTPTLRPPHDEFPYRGQMHYLGTRFHYEDLYGHLTQGSSDGSGAELKDSTLIIPALDENGQSHWPEMHPPEWFHEKKRTYGLIRYKSQYECDTEAMKGKIFQYDHCQVLDDKDFPSIEQIPTYMGIDLAIGEEEQHDMFAIVVVGRNDSGIFVMDFFEGQLRFKDQTEKILELGKRWQITRGGIETNAYQKAQYQAVREANPWLNLRPLVTVKDKVTRAWKLTPLFEAQKVFFRRGQQRLIEHLVLFPDHRLKDLFDAFDLAVQASTARTRKRRKHEPGLI
jgi:phage terminase large subunit-like protein